MQGNMILKKIWLLICCCTLLVGCKSASRPLQQQAAGKRMEGNWVCTDVLNRLAQVKSIRQLEDYPPYTELIFMQDSSTLLALNGQVDMITLSYSCLHGGDALQVSDLDGNEEAYIKMVNDSTLALSNNFSADTWRYEKALPPSVPLAAGSSGVPEVFPALLNQALISGTYTVKNADEPYRIVLRSNGYIAYSADFTRYSLCYNGSCNMYSSEDLIYLSNNQHGDFYGWRMQDSTLTIYSLLPVSMPDEMTEYKFDKPVLVLEKS
jgi:hypothetical protein